MTLEQNKQSMKKFETMINTADLNLANELISPNAKFYTPISPEPLVGGEGYLSVVHFLRSGFSDVKWKLEEMVAERNIVAVCNLTGHFICTHKKIIRQSWLCV